MAAPCFYCHKFHDPGERCSSGSSACSGADAREADKAQPKSMKPFDEWAAEMRSIAGDGWDKVDDVEDFIAELRGRCDCQPLKAAVSPRSSDGLIADKALHLFRLMQVVKSNSAAGFVVVDGQTVRVSIRVAKNTDESRDGWIHSVARTL